MPQDPPFSKDDLRAAIPQALCWADALRFLGYEVKGANYRTLQRHARRWDISTDHFDKNAGRKRAGLSQQIPLERVLVKGSTYARGKLKRRLLAMGLKQAMCEMCGQGENWNGRRMSLILDHINGVANDHRLRTSAWCALTATPLSRRTAVAIPRGRGSVPAAAAPSSLEMSSTDTAQ